MSSSEGSVLVTGAGGFIGSHLAARLVNEGARVRAFVRYDSRGSRGALEWLPDDVAGAMEVVAGDLRDTESIGAAMAGAQTVFHLAAHIAVPYSYDNPRSFFETNVLGSLNVARAAIDADVERVVHTSTSEVYGTARSLPIGEDHPLRAQSPYAASKIGADKLMESFAACYGLPLTVVRPFNTYGPFQSRRAIVPTIVMQALAGGDGATVKLGSLTPRRDLTYVSDTVDGFVKAAASPLAIGETLQLGTGFDVPIATVVDIVGDLLGTTLNVEVDPARIRPERSEVQRLQCDSHHAREVMGWRATVELRDGLARTIEWFRELPHYRRVDEYAR